MNLLAFLLGGYLGYKMGQHAALEMVEELFDMGEPSFADIQAAIAQAGMQ